MVKKGISNKKSHDVLNFNQIGDKPVYATSEYVATLVNLMGLVFHKANPKYKYFCMCPFILK